MISAAREGDLYFLAPFIIEAGEDHSTQIRRTRDDDLACLPVCRRSDRLRKQWRITLSLIRPTALIWWSATAAASCGGSFATNGGGDGFGYDRRRDLRAFRGQT